MDTACRKSIIIFMIVVLVCGCNQSNHADSSGDFLLQGFAQKGPFLKGTSVDVYELSSSLRRTGKSFKTNTVGDAGRYFLPVVLSYGLAEIVVSGVFFDETSNQISGSEVTLRAIANLQEGGLVNVNVLTELSYERTKALVGTGLTFAAAKTQTEQEVKYALWFINTVQNFADFAHLDISKTGEENAFLLIASAILLGVSVDARLQSEFWLALGEDLADNGKIDDIVRINLLLSSARSINLSQVRNNLIARYAAIGGLAHVPEQLEFLLDLEPPGLPVAIIQPQTDVLVNVGDMVTLDGSGSYDPEGDLLRYRWLVTDKHDATVQEYAGAILSFLANKKTTYAVLLVVNDRYDFPVTTTGYRNVVSVDVIAHYRFIDNGDGTVTNLQTGDMWQQVDDNIVHTWQRDPFNRDNYVDDVCADLVLAGYSDWRPPLYDGELQSLVDDYNDTPSIDTHLFPNTKPDIYIGFPVRDGIIIHDPGYGVDFASGANSRRWSGYVRCMRKI